MMHVLGWVVVIVVSIVVITAIVGTGLLMYLQRVAPLPPLRKGMTNPAHKAEPVEQPGERQMDDS